MVLLVEVDTIWSKGDKPEASPERPTQTALAARR